MKSDREEAAELLDTVSGVASDDSLTVAELVRYAQALLLKDIAESLNQIAEIAAFFDQERRGM